MAIFKCLNGKNRYFNPDACEQVAKYILNPAKSLSGFWGATGVTSDIVGSMNEVARRFGKEKGVQLRHFVVSYEPYEMDDPEDVDTVAQEVLRYIGQQYQAIYAVHEDTEHLHFHMMFNSVSFVNGERYRGRKKEHYDLMGRIKEANHLFGVNRLDYVSNTSDEDIQ